MTKFTNCFLRKVFFSIALLFIAWNSQAQSGVPVAVFSHSANDVELYKLNFIHWVSQQTDLSALSDRELVDYQSGNFQDLYDLQVLKGNVSKTTSENPIINYPIMKDNGEKFPLVAITSNPSADIATYKTQLTNWVFSNPLGYYKMSDDFKLYYSKAHATGDFTDITNFLVQKGYAKNSVASSLVANESKSTSANSKVKPAELPYVTMYDDKTTTINNYKKVVLQWKNENPAAFNAQGDKVKDYINNGNFDLLVNMQYLANNFITLK